jgi:hypothetical protein
MGDDRVTSQNLKLLWSMPSAICWVYVVLSLARVAAW